MEFNMEETRRAAAVTAAGRIVVAAAFGLRAREWRESGGVREPGRLTIGSLQAYHCSPNPNPLSDSEAPEPSDAARLPILLAGVVAAYLADHPDAGATEIGDAICDGVLDVPSDDWRLAGTDLVTFRDTFGGMRKYPPIQQAIDAIRSNRDFFDWCVAKLVSEGDLTDGSVAEWIEKNGITRVDIDDDAAAA